MKKIIATFGRDNFVMLRNLIAEAACFNNSERITEVFAGYFRIPDGSPFRKEFQQGHRKNSGRALDDTDYASKVFLNEPE